MTTDQPKLDAEARERLNEIFPACPHSLYDLESEEHAIKTPQPEPEPEGETVEGMWRRFWEPLVCPNGTFDLEQVKKELFDFGRVMEQVSLVYANITGGRISKPNTDAGVVIAVVDDVQAEVMREHEEELREIWAAEHNPTPEVIKYKHHGAEVMVQSHLAGKHREHCLCFFGCKFFKPNMPDNCPLAQELYEYDQRHGMTTPVWECPKYEADPNILRGKVE